MGSKQSQSSKPSPETTAIVRTLMLYMGLLNDLGSGGGLNKLNINPALQGGATSGLSGIFNQPNPLLTGQQSNPFQPNPLSLLPSGQLGPGNLPGTILPNFPNLLNLSGRSFFGSLDPGNLSTTFKLNQEKP
jgi:hypothetical protein